MSNYEKMSFIKTSVVLLCAPALCQGAEFQMLPSVRTMAPIGYPDTVEIVLLNCNEKSDITNHLEKTVNALTENAPAHELEAMRTIDFFNRILQNIAEGGEEEIYEKLETTAERTLCLALQPHKSLYVNMSTTHNPAVPFN